MLTTPKPNCFSLQRCAVLFAITASLFGTACAKSSSKNEQSNSNSNVQIAQDGSVPTGTSASPGEASDTGHREPSLVSISAGAYVVKRPQEWMGDESAFHMLDERPGTKWATPRGVTSPQTIVIALAEKTLLKTLEFDNRQIDGQFVGCGAKDISVEMSDTDENEGFRKIADVTLKDQVDNQRFPVSAEVPGRWVRLTVKNNHGSDPDSTIELNEFRAYGAQLTSTPLPEISGTYDIYFTGDLHLKREGTSVSGCYESRYGRVEGGIEGKAIKLTYYELEAGKIQEMGSAIMVISPDGQQMFGLWTERGPGRERLIIGPKKSSNIGSCPHWAGGVEEQLSRDLDEFGRARVYGINFDSDSDHIKDESKPTLDKIVSILKAKPDLRITIEGHTDSTSTPEHNQQLSERRAQAVKTYLQTAGIDSSRLKALGLGATKPVASNDSELGRAQNRRVELAKL